MPYQIRRRQRANGRTVWCVVKTPTGGGSSQTMGCHSTRSAAESQRTALRIVESRQNRGSS